MRIALLLSGRAVRYEVCLLPILQKAPYDIDIFMSINDEPCAYYETMKETLKPWLRDIYIHPFTVPSELPIVFQENDYRYCYQKIQGEWKPRNQLSMFWNDTNAFTMATRYAEQKGIVYDCFMKFRTDIFNTAFPTLSPISLHETKIYSIDPLCCFTSFGIHPRKIVSSDWVWGNQRSMAIYCNTYEFVLQKLLEKEGNYIVHFESCHTDMLVEQAVQIEYIKIQYNIDSNRKIFDRTWKVNEDGTVDDSRKIPPKGFQGYAFMSSLTTTEHIPVIAE